jgi:hypothetical protein
MAALTDSDIDAFSDYVQGVLDKNQSAIKTGDGAGSGWDPSSRVTQLSSAGQAVIDAEGVEAQMEQALRAQTKNKQTLRTARYDLASASLSAVEGSLGKKHPLTREMRQKRSTFSKSAKKSKPPTP